LPLPFSPHLSRRIQKRLQRRTFSLSIRGPYVHLCVQSSKVYAKMDTNGTEQERKCPHLRTVCPSVRKDGHIRPRIVAQKSKTAYSSPKCTQTWTV
jgi:hypothetical protein